MYKLTIYPALEKDPSFKIEQEFVHLQEMKAAADLSANMLLALQDNLEEMEAYSNMFIEEVWCEDGECWDEFI